MINIGKDLLKLLLLSLPLILIISGFNFFIDPANIYKTRSFEKAIIKTLDQGYNAAFSVTMSQVDEVLILKSYVEKLKLAPDYLVIGSSRSFTINQQMFNGHSFYNASVSSCKIGDLIAIYNLFEKKNLTPDTLYIETSPDFFVLPPYPKENLWEDFYEATNHINVNFTDKERLEHFQKVLSYKLLKIGELLSPAYFQDSLKFLLIKNFSINIGDFNNSKISANNIAKMNYWGTLDLHAPGGVIFPDGSREFGDNVIYLSNNHKLSYTNNLILDMDRIKTRSYLIRADSLKIFEAFIQHLKTKKVKCIFVLIPHHSLFTKYEEQLNPGHSVPEIVEKYLLKYAAENNIEIIGSYNQSKIGFTDDDMIDHHHPQRASMSKLISNQYNKVI